MSNYYLSLLITAALGTSAAFAQTGGEALVETYLPEAEEITPATETATIPQEADTQARLWLQLQSSGALAASRYTVPGQAATLIYQRYLNSFSHPIPEQFEFADTGGSGSSGASTGR